MKKNFKKCLSYVLGVVLAMGLGLSYAYAVGANDSNAFVTKTEFEAKVAQIETSLDNVNKTIRESNMDFMMNGPRLKVTMYEGLENVGYVSQYANNVSGLVGEWYRYTTEEHWFNKFFNTPHIYLSDRWDGTQAITHTYWDTGNMSYSMYPTRMRYALKTDDPNIYLVVYNYRFDTAKQYGGYYIYFDLTWDGSSPNYYAQAKTVNLTFDSTKMRNLSGDVSGSISRTNSYLYAGTSYGWDYENWTSSNADGRESNQNGYITRTVDSTNNKVTVRLEYPANCHVLRYNSSNSPVDEFPIDMKGKKIGTRGDNLTSSLPVSKVWSPQKNSLCLKNYLNGEIPILNE